MEKCVAHPRPLVNNRCVFCDAKASGHKIPEDRFDENPIPWTQRPVKVRLYKWPVGIVFTPIAPEGTLMPEHDEETDARLDNVLMEIFGQVSNKVLTNKEQT